MKKHKKIIFLLTIFILFLLGSVLLTLSFFVGKSHKSGMLVSGMIILLIVSLVVSFWFIGSSLSSGSSIKVKDKDIEKDDNKDIKKDVESKQSLDKEVVVDDKIKQLEQEIEKLKKEKIKIMNNFLVFLLFKF
ncbi:hypothetical protein NPX79_02035 [Spiroplasma endosymbiont of Anurida maritima]|uniref:hypothetical protein n=1 Tax=Spiroplasma endosymbiont of Anurida maritima TaxID=2967972 RepID=UPI0036D224E8